MISDRPEEKLTGALTGAETWVLVLILTLLHWWELSKPPNPSEPQFAQMQNGNEEEEPFSI